MIVSEFLAKAEADAMEWAEGECPEGPYKGKPGWFVRVPWCRDGDGKPVGCHLIKECVEKNDWPVLRRGILQGYDVNHFTRIVGYFSAVSNWNASKIGELRDRRRGTYVVSDIESVGVSS